MSRAVLSLGANLGDRAAALRAALTALQDDGLVARYSTAEFDDGLPGDEGTFLACSFWLAGAYAISVRKLKIKSQKACARAVAGEAFKRQTFRRPA